MDLAFFDTTFGPSSPVDESNAATPFDESFWASLATPFDLGAAGPQPLSGVEGFDLSFLEAGPAPLIV